VAHVDEFTPALVTIDSVHEMHHLGLIFSSFLVDLALGAASDLEVLVRTAVGQVAHARLRSSASADYRLLSFEAVESSADGAAVARINRNRVSANTAATLVFSGPTVTGDGTLLSDGFVPGGSTGNAPGGSSSSFEELVLAADTDYLLRLTNLTAGEIIASMALDWYEPA
jgi:hypothetical protein